MVTNIANLKIVDGVLRLILLFGGTWCDGDYIITVDYNHKTRSGIPLCIVILREQMVLMMVCNIFECFVCLCNVRFLLPFMYTNT